MASFEPKVPWIHIPWSNGAESVPPAALQNWLYEEGEDETKSVYVEKLVELRKQGDPIVVRPRFPQILALEILFGPNPMSSHVFRHESLPDEANNVKRCGLRSTLRKLFCPG